MNDKVTRLTKADLEAIEHEVQQLVGDAPTLESLAAEGHQESWWNGALDFIAGAGRLLTLVIVEFVQAFGAVALATLFILLEADRVYHGVLALGQHSDQAVLIAVTLTAMNAVIPIYALRNVQSQAKLDRTRWTVRGHLESFWRRLTARPQTYSVDVYSNPALAVAETTITWATLFLAFFAVLGPLLVNYTGEVWFSAIGSIVGESNITEMLGLVAGLLLSIGGVFGVQSISHELACRLLMDKPPRVVDVLAARRLDHQQRTEAIRDEVRARFMAAKLSDAERKESIPFGLTVPAAVANGNGHRTANGNGHIGDESVTK